MLVLTTAVRLLITAFSLLNGKAIDVYVGQERRQFSVHAGLLRTAPCAFIAEKMGEEDSKEVFLAEEDADVFEMFVQWLYTRKVKAVTTKFTETANDFKKDHSASVEAHVKLYLMAETRDVKNLKNLTMDRLREYCAAEKMTMGPDICGLIYQQSQSESPLRQYVEEIFLLHWLDKRRSSESAAKLLRRVFRMKYGERFAMDICLLMRSKLNEKPWPSPNRKGCLFHDHEDGDGCEDEVGE